MSRRLERYARQLKHTYNCNVKLVEYSPAETSDGYPEMFDVIIENWNTWKGSFRIADGMFIREGRDLNGPGTPVHRLYRQMREELRAHAERIKLHEEARETNSVIFNGELIPCENVDAHMYLCGEYVFRIYTEEGRHVSARCQMTKLKHTPGPWALDDNAIISGNGHGRYAIALSVNRTADARLIAAAPELLEQLRRLVFFYEQMRPKIKLAEGYPDPTGFIENLDHKIPHLKVAIAKATGGES